MKRLQTRFEYHGASLLEARWSSSGDLQLLFELSADWNNSLSLRIELVFYGVCNRSAIEEDLREFAANATSGAPLADVVALRRVDEGSFLLDTSRGSLRVDASSFAEL